MMESRPGWYGVADAWFKLLAAIVLGYLILSGVVGLLHDFSDVATIALGAVFLAYFVYPAVAWLNKRLPLWAALTIVYVLLFSVVGIVFYFLVPPAVTQLDALITNLPTMQRSVESYLNHPTGTFVERLPPQIQSYIHKLPGQITHELQNNATAYTSKVFNAVVVIATVLATAIAIPIVSIYMLGESSIIKRFFVRAFPPRQRPGVVSFLADVDNVLGGFVRGQLIVAAVVGILAIIALLILRVPYALLIGAWAGIADIIPYIGPFAGAIPAAIVAVISNGVADMFGVGIAFTIINQLEGHFLGPRIVSRTVNVTPLTVIFALLVGAHLFGIAGLIVSVPLAGIVRVILLRLFPERDVTNEVLQPGLTHPPQDEVKPTATEA